MDVVDALDLLARVPSVLVFLTALTVVAECASIAGVFDFLSTRFVALARGRIALVWVFFMTTAVLVTAFLSLDTTAVLMTSAAVVVARRLDRPVALFAFPTLWIANMASLWLPTSNLTNLLARDILPHPNALGFVARAWPVALTTALVPLLVAVFVWRSSLRGTASSPAQAARPPSPHDGVLPAVGTLVGLMCGAILVVEPALAASVAAIACVAVIAVRRRGALAEIEVPWRSLAITSALFVTVAIVHGFGVLRPALGSLEDAPAWTLTALGAIIANGVNNLPAYLALEPATHGQMHRVLALLVGVNVASGITWWGSVATLLWRDRLRRAGVRISWATHVRLTGLATLITTLAAVAELDLVSH